MPRQTRPRLAPNWPFDPARWPFFYGWVIWLLSTLGVLMSIPGQTMGMAVFTDYFISAFELSRTELSFAYLCGTVASAFLLTRAGRWYDRVGARIVIVTATVGLGLVVAYLTTVDRVGGWLAAELGIAVGMVTFPLVLIGYFGVRFTGQGVLTNAAGNVLVVWWERRRGLVSGLRSVFTSMGFSVAPLLLALLIDAYGWRGALLLLSAVLILGYALLALVFVRDSPEGAGLYPDGVSAADVTSVTGDVEGRDDVGLSKARRTPLFWLYAGGLAIHALFGTALTFHVVSIFAAAGRSQAEAFGYFLPVAIVSTCANMSVSALADYVRLKPFLVTMLGAFLLGTWGLQQLETSLGYGLLVAGFGIGGGLWAMLHSLAYVRFFGRRYLGEITGFGTAITVFASAIGPILFSLSLDWTGAYTAAELLCGGVIAVLLVAALVLPQPERRGPPRRPSPG